MPSTGYGRLVGIGVPITASTLLARPDLPRSAAAAVANDYFWGTGVAGPLPPIEIPVIWLTQPVRLRLEPPFNIAVIARPGGTPARATDAASIAAYQSRPFSATLTTVTGADPANLASWVITYRSAPAMRAPELHLDLMSRTDVERIRILRITRGRRIRITGVPAEFPVGAADLIVSGIAHEIGLTRRRVRLTTTAVVGTVPGTPGPWFRTDASVTDGTHVMPF